MRARMFFSVLKKGREIYQRERGLFLLDLCNVAGIAANVEHYKTTREMILSRMRGPAPKARPLRSDSKDTFDIVASMLRAAAPHMRGLDGRRQ